MPTANDPNLESQINLQARSSSTLHDSKSSTYFGTDSNQQCDTNIDQEVIQA